MLFNDSQNSLTSQVIFITIEVSSGEVRIDALPLNKPHYARPVDNPKTNPMKEISTKDFAKSLGMTTTNAVLVPERYRKDCSCPRTL